MVVVAYLSSSGSGRGVGWGGRLLTFSAFRMGAYSRWALIRGWALIRINTVCPSEDGLDKRKHEHKNITTQCSSYKYAYALMIYSHPRF